MKDTDSEQADAPADTQAPVAPVTQNDASQPGDASTPAQPAAPSVKNRGRFMDVKPSNNPMPPVKPTDQVSHQAPTIEVPQAENTLNEPVDTVIEPQQAEQSVEQPPVPAITIGDYAADPASVREDSVAVASAAPVADTPKDDSAHNSFTMPDPIDMATAAEQQPTVEQPAEAAPSSGEAAPEQPPAVTADELKLDTEVQPEPAMDSPFIADAKVEKRPLGGAPEGTSADNITSVEAKPEETAPLPRELGSDLMNLETDGNDVGGDNKGEPKADAPVEPEVQPKVPEQVEAKAAAVPAAEPANDTKVTGAIFDTANYHNMPVVAPVKKKHGWMIIIWILILLIVGASAGAAYFYFTTQ
jgi:hypothetical protein